MDLSHLQIKQLASDFKEHENFEKVKPALLEMGKERVAKANFRIGSLPGELEESFRFGIDYLFLC